MKLAKERSAKLVKTCPYMPARYAHVIPGARGHMTSLQTHQNHPFSAQ